jgi:monovalent cation:H+ antiporter-2, CPA2 family
MHDTALITTIAFGFAAALFFGLIAKRLGLSPIVGYVLAGILAGPQTPGFVGDIALATQLAEIGVIMLMFGVGLHFHLKDLLAVRGVAVPGALLQSAFATAASMLVAHAFGWSWTQGLVLGIATSVASTVVLLRVLIDNGVLETSAGHAVVGWLIVEDIITVLVLVVLPALGSADGGGGSSVLMAAGLALGKLVMLGLVVAVVGTRVVPWLLLRVARLRSPELFTLSVLVMSIAVATAAYVAFGVSMALGAFLAGMLVGQSKFSHQAGADMLPMRDAFAVLFFVSIGMLFDARVLVDSPLLVLGVTLVILVVKPIVAFAIVIVRRYTLKTALMAAGALAQIGEFSFIVADVALDYQLLPQDAHAILVASAIVSISANPFVFKWMLALEPAIANNRLWQRWFARLADSRGAAGNADFAVPGPTQRYAIVIGHGPVGATVAELLQHAGIEPVIVEMNVDTVSMLQASGRRALYGDATRREILEQAGVDKATNVIITIPDPGVRLGIIAAARDLNPGVLILTRARFLAEHDSLRAAGASVVCCDEGGAATALVENLLDQIGAEHIDISRELRRIREGWSPDKPAEGKSAP